MADTMKRAKRATSAKAAAPLKAAQKSGGRRSAQRTSEETVLRRKVIETALEMSRSGLSPGRSGNVSCRFGDGMLITPSGMAYGALKVDDIVFLGGDGVVREGARAPSSEWRFHLAAYQARAEAQAVVHTHSLHATVLACANRPIPAFHYMVAVAGGVDIPCIPYATFGTEALADLVARGLKDRNACLMANHGQIAVGGDLDGALELAHGVEVLSEQYVKLLATGVEPVVLRADDMAEVLERFKGYGQKAQG
jgi:L-ribulose-5-phosphate 4-epimerase